MTERVLALETKQEIIRVASAPIGCAHPVVVGTVAKEQQETGHLLIRLGAVVEHLHIPAISRCVGGAAAELVIELIGRDDTYRKTVTLFVQLLDALRLTQPFLRGGDDDHHIDCRICVVVLVHQSIDERGLREDRRRQTGHRSGCLVAQCQVVEAQVMTAGLGDRHRIIAWFQVLQPIGPRAGIALGVRVERYVHTQLAYHGVVHCHRTLKTTIITHHNRQRTRSAVARQRIVLRGSCLIECLVVEIPAPMIPGKVVHLIERVIIVVRGIVGSSKGRAVNCERLVVTLCQEITAHI